MYLKRIRFEQNVQILEKTGPGRFGQYLGAGSKTRAGPVFVWRPAKPSKTGLGPDQFLYIHS